MQEDSGASASSKSMSYQCSLKYWYPVPMRWLFITFCRNKITFKNLYSQDDNFHFFSNPRAKAHLVPRKMSRYSTPRNISPMQQTDTNNKTNNKPQPGLNLELKDATLAWQLWFNCYCTVASAFSHLPCLCLQHFCCQCIGGSCADKAVSGVEQHSWHLFCFLSKHCVLLCRSSADAAEAAEPSLHEEWDRLPEMKSGMVSCVESLYTSVLNQSVLTFIACDQFVLHLHLQLFSPMQRPELPLSSSFNIVFQWFCKMKYHCSA